MNILLFSITIVIPVAEVSCLEYPHIQAHQLKSFMVGYATDLAGILFFLLYFTTANALVGMITQFPHWHLQ